MTPGARPAENSLEAPRKNLGFNMDRKKVIETLAVAGVGAAIGVAGIFCFTSAADHVKANRLQSELNAQILSATPAREIVVMHADANVIGSANKRELLNTESKLYYISRARFAYSVDMRALKPSSFSYDAKRDVLTITLPKIKIQSDVYGERERLASLSFLASEGGSGNELERIAASSLERNALAEASRPELVMAAVNSAKYEISKLYEDAFRASGQKTRVVVSSIDEIINPAKL